MATVLAGVQMDVTIGDRHVNRERMKARARQARSEHGATLIVFPECVLGGYCFESRDEGLAVAETRDGDSCVELIEAARELGVHLVYGYLERRGDRLHNALNVVGPDGLIATYRKTHLPYLGIDRFVDPGDEPYRVVEAGELRLGLLICYDGSFPEPSRVLALAGADLILLPTNWPPGSGCTADFVPGARALENAIYFAAVNRVGEERGFAFVGKSRLVDPNGCTLALAQEPPCEEILIATIEPEFARQKHLKRIPGKHEIHRFRDRRPDLYGPIVEPLKEGPIR